MFKSLELPSDKQRRTKTIDHSTLKSSELDFLAARRQHDLPAEDDKREGQHLDELFERYADFVYGIAVLGDDLNQNQSFITQLLKVRLQP